MRHVISFIFIAGLFFICSPVFADNEEMGIKIDMTPWENVNKLLPRYSKFTVMDVETGKRFNVQRRAGSRHADVQPLTAADTKIMKEIYGGKWSWKRRAIIVIYRDQWIAASMHGMPHGAGKLVNNFPGHFCIHFNGSKTHRSNFMDLSHKIMVLKAAGKLQSYAASTDPYELVSIFVAGIKQQDPWITSIISLQNVGWEKQIETIENIKLTRISAVAIEDLVDELSLEVPVDIEWFSHSKMRTFKGNIYLFRSSPTDAWKIDSRRFLEESCLFEDEEACEKKDKE